MVSLKAVDQRIGRNLVAALVDRGVTPDTPHRIAPPFQFNQSPFARRVNVGAKRHKDHATSRVHRMVRRPWRPSPSRLLGLAVDTRSNGHRLPLRWNAHKAEQIAHPGFRVQRLVGIEQPNMFGIADHQFAHTLVILIPVATDSFFAILRIVMRIRAGAIRIVMPTRRRPLRPVVRWQRHGLVEPLTKTGDHLLPRASETHNTNIRLGRNGVFQIGQVEVRHVAQQADFAVLSESRKPFPNYARSVRVVPRQQRRLIVGADHVRLLPQNVRQRCRTTASGANTKNNRLLHGGVTHPQDM